MKQFWFAVLVLIAAAMLQSCAETRSGGVEKSYEVTIQNSDGGTVTITFTLDAETMTDTQAGDADATASPDLNTSLALSGAQATSTDDQGTTAQVQPTAEQKISSENTQTTTTTTAPEKPGTSNSGTTSQTGSDEEEEYPGYTVLETVKKCGTMGYTHDGETSSTPQDVFKFSKPASEYSSPLQVMWSDGEYLNVPNAENMAWSTESAGGGFRKWRPGGTECEGEGVEVYAARGTNPETASILVKKSSALDGVVPSPSEGKVTMKFEMTTQCCGSEGGWDFDSSELIVKHGWGESKYSGSSLSVKKSPFRSPTWEANISDIPAGTEIESATLNLHIRADDGIANADDEGVVKVTDSRTGGTIKEISAKTDIKGKGYNKATKPDLPIDFTEYVQAVYANQ